MAALTRVLKWLAIAVAILLLIAQAIRPARTNPPADPARGIERVMGLRPDVAAVLDRGCRDCHTNRTVWPWYTNVAPVSWFVINHVNQGRRHLNFSDWAALSPSKADHLLEEMCTMVRSREMPMPSYLWMHNASTLSDEEIRLLCEWTDEVRKH